MQPWSVKQVWNESFKSMPVRKIEPRDYLYASELLAAPIDIFLKMKGVEQTNPPNDRARRKFEVGNIMEWLVRLVLLRSGLLKETQERVNIELPGLLSVHGRLDFIAGGRIDYERALYDVSHLDLPPFLDHAAREVLAYYKNKIGDRELMTYVLEAKSCSSTVFQGIERTGNPMPGHNMQNFHYVLAKKMDEGKLLYISKDDALMEEFPVPNNEENFTRYKTFLELVTGYVKADEMPPKEDMILWDAMGCRFTKNFKVEYSGYLTNLYGFETPGEYRLMWQKTINDFNRVMKRVLNGDNMTAANKEIIAVAKKMFPWDDLVSEAQSKGVLEEESEDA